MTKKECITQLIKQGKSNQEIASILKQKNLTSITKSSDKITLNQRAKVYDKYHDKFMRAVENPLSSDNRWWMKLGKKEAWQFMKNAQEISAVTNDSTHKVHCSIDGDGTCSGLQMHSMLSLDSKLARSVNVANNATSQDIYADVAESMVVTIDEILAGNNDLNGTLKDDEKSTREQKIECIRKWKECGVVRNQTKRIVMCLAYSLAEDGKAKYSIEAAGMCAPNYWNSYEQEFSIASNMFHKIINIALEDAAPMAMRNMRTFKKVAAYCGMINKPVLWKPPVTNFQAVNIKEKINTKTIDVRYNGTTYVSTAEGMQKLFETKRARIDIVTKTGETNAEKMATGIAPDVIHSLDAAMLTLAVKIAHDMGVKVFTLVHDSFGTLPCYVDKFNEAIRQAAYQIFGQGNYMQTWCCQVIASANDLESVTWEQAKDLMNDVLADKHIKSNKALIKAQDNLSKANTDKQKEQATVRLNKQQSKLQDKVHDIINKKGLQDSDIVQGNFDLSEVLKSQFFVS